MKITAAITASLLAINASAQSCPASLADTINAITSVSIDTNNLASTINAFNFAVVGPQIVSDFTQILAYAQQAAVDLGSSGTMSRVKRGVLDGSQMFAKPVLQERQVAVPCSTEVQQAICTSITNFVQAHKTLLSTLIGKAGVLRSTPFTTPIAQALSTIESFVDMAALSVIQFIPACAAGAQANFASLEGSLQTAILTFNPSATFSTTLASTLPAATPTNGGGTGATVTVTVTTTTTTSSCAATPTCTQIVNTAPDNTYVCGAKGTLSKPALLATGTTATAADCAKVCAVGKRLNGALTCFGFGFNPATGICRTFFRAPVFMGYAADDTSGELIYNINCFRTSCPA